MSKEDVRARRERIAVAIYGAMILAAKGKADLGIEANAAMAVDWAEALMAELDAREEQETT